MPMLTAQRHHRWTKQPPNNLYHFPEEHKAGWSLFWETCEGDLEKVLAFAEKSGVDCPKEWTEALHRFLFDTFAGDEKLLKKAAKEAFGKFLAEVAKNHQEEPKPKSWYTSRGILHSDFVAMLERAADIIDIRQAIAHINARVKDLGFYLYSEYLLAKTDAKEQIKSVASSLNKQAYELESEVIGTSPLDGIEEGCVVAHTLFPNEKFMVTEVVQEKEHVNMLVARDTKGKVAFIKDLWNVQSV